ncbi:hypothetical protein D3C81_1164830 [compost metagenome]
MIGFIQQPFHLGQRQPVKIHLHLMLRPAINLVHDGRDIRGNGTGGMLAAGAPTRTQRTLGEDAIQIAERHLRELGL